VRDSGVDARGLRLKIGSACVHDPPPICVGAAPRWRHRTIHQLPRAPEGFQWVSRYASWHISVCKWIVRTPGHGTENSCPRRPFVEALCGARHTGGQNIARLSVAHPHQSPRVRGVGGHPGPHARHQHGSAT
jgi:hypothetical protein